MPTEATFLLAGLLIVFAATGWAFAWFGDRDRDAELPARINADYIRCRYLVLNRRTDEALELFLQMAKVDDETLETHFALGHLFRQRGEMERAIRVDQNLLARPSLSQAQRDQALYALGEDYLGAGLFDRAESLFKDLTDSDTVAGTALERLVYIYEREQEWEKAIDAQRRLEAQSGEKSSHVAHYYCELAERARHDGDLARARDYLKHTVRSEAGALRGSLIRAAIAKEEGDHAQALGLYEQVLDRDSRFMPEVLPELFDCYAQTHASGEFEQYIERLVGRDRSTVGNIAYASIIGDLSGSEALRRCVEEFVYGDETLARLVDVDSLRSATPEHKSQALERISNALRNLGLASARYRCTNCGFSTRRFIWHCPSCKLWETLRPIQRFQLDSVMG